MDAFKEAFDYSSHPWSIVEDAPFFPVNAHTSVRLFFNQLSLARIVEKQVNELFQFVLSGSI